MSKFSKWLAQLLRQSDRQVNRLLEDKSALHFLMAWSLLESKCFEGFVRADSLRSYANRIVSENMDGCTFKSEVLGDTVSHFHERYQHKEKVRHLLHDDKPPKGATLEFANCLTKDEQELDEGDKVFLVLFVIYRYRNNMFHGNKGIDSWLKYKPQIQRCTLAIQELVLHAEAQRPSLAA